MPTTPVDERLVVTAVPGDAELRFRLVGLPGEPILSGSEALALAARLIYLAGPLRHWREVQRVVYDTQGD